jgi:hypothetical protein
MNRAFLSLPLPLVLLVSAPAQTFTDVAAAHGFPSSNDSTRGMAWADFDGDGDFDVYLQNQGSTSRLLRNDGGTFTDVTAVMSVSHPSSGWSAAWGDYDNDGKLDLYLGNFTDNNLFKNRFPAAFTDEATAAGCADRSFAQGVSWIDHDRDGDLDLYVTQELDPFRFFVNQGNGTFVDASVATGLRDPQAAGYGLTWGDFDGDGDFDCFVSTCGAGTINRLFRNNLPGTVLYTEIAAAAGVNYQPNTYGAHFADLDDDGDLDLFVAGARGEANLLYRNDRTLPLVEIAAAAGIAGPLNDGHGCTIGDYDNDGFQDVYVLDFQGTNRLYRNLGGMRFSEVPQAAGANATGQQGYDCVFVDFDNDGDLDIHSASSGRDRLYRNSGNANHWLQVVAVGTVDNRAAIGATVEIEVAGRRQWRLLNASAGAFSQNVLPAHFGLAGATVVDRITVHWLDGTTDTRLSVAADQRVRIVQSSGAAAVSALGAGCANAAGRTPSLSSATLPVLGGTLSLVVANTVPSVPAAWLTSVSPLPSPFDLGNGCILQPSLATLITLAGTTTSAGGSSTLALPVPATRALLGLRLLFQTLVLDPTGPVVPVSGLRFTITNAVDVRLGV